MRYNLVDIHFHTDDSFDAYEGESFDIDKVCNIVENEIKVNLICKTDHNLFNYNKYENYKVKFREKGIHLLPGIEINGNTNIHWVFIFDDRKVDLGIPEKNDYIGKVLDQEINTFFGYDENIDLKHQAKIIQQKETNIKDFIKILHRNEVSYLAIPHFNKSSGWYDHLKKDPKQLLLLEEFLYSNIINGFESKNQDDFISNNIKQTEKHIKGFESLYTNLSEVSSEESKAYYKKEIQKRVEHLLSIQRTKEVFDASDIAQIYGSDFHCRHGETIASYNDYKSKLFYMKADNTFEGLRISLLDQESRIFSFKRKEKFDKKNTTWISKITIEQGGKEVNLNLGDGLNCIIGARGAGKSYLLNLLLGRETIYKEAEISSQIKLKQISMGNGDIKDKLPITDYDVLMQRGNHKHAEFVENSIYDILADAPFKPDAYLKEIRRMASCSSKAQKNIEDVFCKINILRSLFVELNEFRTDGTDYSYFKTYDEFYDNQTEVMKIHEWFMSAEDEIKSELERLDFNLTEYKNNSERLQDLKKFLKGTSFATEVSELSFSFNDDIKNIESLENKISELSKLTLKKQTKLKKIDNYIKDVIKKLKGSFSNTETVFSTKLAELKNLTSKVYNKLIETKDTRQLIQPFFSQKVTDEEVLTLNVGNKKYNFKIIKEIDLNNLSEQQYHEVFSKYKSSYDSQMLKKIVFSDNFEKYYITLYSQKDGRSKEHEFKSPIIESVILLDFGNSEYKNWKDISPGERADKLLDIVLNGDTGKILLIDQPEDDLDNETIYRTMVQKIRELKLRRQVIAVSHNANVGITADSDSIIICQHDGDIYSYYSDSIESTKLYDYVSINSRIERQSILNIAAEILDGGKEALRKRVRKIGYKNIFYKEV